MINFSHRPKFGEHKKFLLTIRLSVRAYGLSVCYPSTLFTHRHRRGIAFQFVYTKFGGRVKRCTQLVSLVSPLSDEDEQ